MGDAAGMDPKPTVIVFDFDGVLADSFDAYFSTFVSVCTEMGYRRLNSKEAFLKLFEGNPIRQLLWAGFPLFRLKRLVLKFAPRIREAHRRVAPFAGMPELVRDLARRFPVYIVTTNIAVTVGEFLNRFGVDSVAEILGSDIETSKVKKIRSIVRRHPGAAVYFVTDTKGDLIEARAAGAVSVAVTWGWHPAPTLHEGRPAHVVDTPEMLRALFQA